MVWLIRPPFLYLAYLKHWFPMSLLLLCICTAADTDFGGCIRWESIADCGTQSGKPERSWLPVVQMWCAWVRWGFGWGHAEARAWSSTAGGPGVALQPLMMTTGTNKAVLLWVGSCHLVSLWFWHMQSPAGLLRVQIRQKYGAFLCQ